MYHFWYSVTRNEIVLLRPHSDDVVSLLLFLQINSPILENISCVCLCVCVWPHSIHTSTYSYRLSVFLAAPTATPVMAITINVVSAFTTLSSFHCRHCVFLLLHAVTFQNNDRAGKFNLCTAWKYLASTAFTWYLCYTIRMREQRIKPKP